MLGVTSLIFLLLRLTPSVRSFSNSAPLPGGGSPLLTVFEPSSWFYPSPPPRAYSPPRGLLFSSSSPSITRTRLVRELEVEEGRLPARYLSVLAMRFPGSDVPRSPRPSSAVDETEMQNVPAVVPASQGLALSAHSRSRGLGRLTPRIERSRLDLQLTDSAVDLREARGSSAPRISRSAGARQRSAFSSIWTFPKISITLSAISGSLFFPSQRSTAGAPRLHRIRADCRSRSSRGLLGF